MAALSRAGTGDYYTSLVWAKDKPDGCFKVLDLSLTSYGRTSGEALAVYMMVGQELICRELSLETSCPENGATTLEARLIEEQSSPDKLCVASPAESRYLIEVHPVNCSLLKVSLSCKPEGNGNLARIVQSEHGSENGRCSTTIAYGGESSFRGHNTVVFYHNPKP